jgi:hypothetical protein
MRHTMRHIVPAAAALTLLASLAYAQNTSSQSGPQNPAIKGVHENNASMPVSGANSFTRREAVKQIEAKGYTHVVGLKKGHDGVWRGKATKDGTSGPISVD